MSERVYSIETPENLVLYFERAGLASRAAAHGIDLIAMAAITQCSVWLLTPLGLLTSSAAAALWIIAAFVVQWGYGALSEWRFAGRTLGKRLCGLAVVDASGLRLTFGQAAVRNLLRVVDLLPGFYLLGALSCFVDSHNRRLGDLAARTLVISARRPRAPTHASRAVGVNPLGQWEAPILKHLRSDEREAVIALAATLETLSIHDRLSLCSSLIEHLLRRHQLELPGHLSAERVVLLLRDAIAASRASSPSPATR